MAQRENKSKSELLIELIKTHVKAHDAGNPNFTLDTIFKAYPTPYDHESFKAENLLKYSTEERLEMKDHLERSQVELAKVLPKPPRGKNVYDEFLEKRAKKDVL